MITNYLFLMAAILFEVVATTALKASNSFSKLIPTVILLLCYTLAFWCLTFPMRIMPTGVIYAIWSGLGIVLISAINYFFYKEPLDFPAMIGLSLIILGVLIINIFSKTITH